MTQLCVTLPALPPPLGVELLSGVLATGKVAAVIIMAPEGGPIAPAAALPLVAAAQKAGAAALVYADAQMARTLKSDGVHLPWSEDIVSAAGEAREILGQSGIVGAEAGALRHDAMELGERGVDYVAFGEPTGGGDAADLRLEQVAWWAEIFEVPVVALGVTTPQDAAALTAVDADFICVSIASPDDVAALRTIIDAISGALVAPAA